MTRPGLSSPTFLVFPFLLAIGVRAVASWISHGRSVVDVASFEHWANQLDAGQNPFLEATNPANYPPLWVYLCWGCLVLARCTNLSFDLVMKLLVSTCDAATVVPVGLMAAAQGASVSEGRVASFAYALNPVAILVAAFHAQNDPIVVGLIMWSVWLIARAPCPWAAELGALVLGASLCIKPVGLLMLPLMLAATTGWRRRAVLLVLVALPMLLSALPYLINSPRELVAAAGTYRGPPDFGYVGIYNAWMNFGHGSSGEPIVDRLPAWMRLAYVAVFALVWWEFRCASLAEQAKAILLSLYLFYGALGAQYLVWIVPFAAATRDRHLLRVSIITSIALVAFYQLNHPAILTGRPGVQWKTGIAIPQWTGILLVAQVALYVLWLRWMRALMDEYQQHHPDQLTVGRFMRRLMLRSGERTALPRTEERIEDQLP